METTSIVIEFVIIGFQVVIWIILLFLSIWGYAWVDLPALRDWAGIFTIGLIAVSYTFGLIFDSIIGNIFKFWSYSESKNISKIINLENTQKDLFNHESPAKMRAYIIASAPNLTEEINKINYQNKLLRATSINFILISLVALLFVATRIGVTWQSITTILLFPIFLTICSLWAWRKSYSLYYYELGQIYLTLVKKEKEIRY
jgi:hypothetical protein